jgi:hypothetical protein
MNTINPISKTPPTNTELLVYDKSDGWAVAVLYSYGWEICVHNQHESCFSLQNVTYWMELPPNPLA